MEYFLGLMIPLFGTSLGAVFVVFSKKKRIGGLESCLNQFAAGVMMAASIWSLLIPSIEQSEALGKFSSFPAVSGFWMGILFFSWIQKRLPVNAVPSNSTIPDMEQSNANKLRLFLLAIVIHNIPEGMAVGASFSESLFGGGKSMLMPAFVLSFGIAVQNIPEGAIISLPLYSRGMNKRRACFYGILSGIVEPAAGAMTILLSGFILPVLPYLLSFSAGAMIYVVVTELIPSNENQQNTPVSTYYFSAGFSLMMILDIIMKIE